MTIPSGLLVLVLMLIGIVFAIINNETKGSVFWFWLALLCAIILWLFRI